MLLQNQVYSFNIKAYNKREILFYYYNHNNFICIDGFIEKKISPCIVLVPSTLKRNFIPHDKILPIVCLIKDPDENIIKKCEENKKILEKKNERKKNFFDDEENDNCKENNHDDEISFNKENEGKIIHISQSHVQNNKINVYLKKNNTFTGNFNIDENYNINTQPSLNENHSEFKKKHKQKYKQREKQRKHTKFII